MDYGNPQTSSGVISIPHLRVKPGNFAGAPTVVLYVIAEAEASDIFILIGPSDGKVLTGLKKVRDKR